MPLSKFESMLKTDDVYFFDSTEFQEIIQHYLDIGKLSLAKKALSLAIAQHPTSIVIKLLKVEILVFNNELKQAFDLLTEIEAVEPCNDEVFFQKATILSKNQQHIEAIATLKRALEYAEDPVDIWSMMGMEYLYLDDYENARLNFAKCIDVDYEDYSSLYNIVYCFDMQDDSNAAIHFLNTYLDKNPYSEVAWHQLGKQYFQIGMFKEALAAFDYAIIIDDSFIGGYLEKAKTLEKLDRYSEAIENYMLTLELDDPTAFAYVRIGECFEKLDNITTAIKYYHKAINEDPSLDKGWVLLTTAYCINEDYEKALYYVNKAIQIDEDNLLYWRLYADISIRRNSLEDAVKAYNKCLNLDDVEIETYIALSDVLFLLGEHNDALSVLIKAKKTYRDFAEIEYRLCGLFLTLGKEEYGLTHLKNALAIDYEYHKIIEELYPKVYCKKSVITLIVSYKKLVN